MIADSYWDMLKGLSRDVKLDLIDRLSTSVSEESKGKIAEDDRLTESMIRRFCGAWKGDESAEDIISTINAGKKSKDEPIAF